MVIVRRNRFEPFRRLEDVQQLMNRMVDEGFVRPLERQWLGRGCLPVDVYSTPEAFVVQADVPGARPEDVNVTLEGDTLTIKASLPEPLEGVEYSLQERDSGEFSRTLSFSVAVQPETAEATFENGVLTLTIPKAEEVKPKTIKIKTG